MQDRTYFNCRSIGLVVWMVTCCLAADSYGQACKTNGDPPDIPATMKVCATWDAGGDPLLGTDFTVDYLCTGCWNAPRVEFIVGGSGSAIAWVLYSEVISTQAPANLGHVLLADDVSPDNGEFDVKFRNGTSAGADDVSSIVLDSADASWTGHSAITAGSLINGDITGALSLVEDSFGGGGEVGGLIVIGSIGGLITLPKVTGDVLILGNVSQKVEIEEIDEGSFMISGSLTADLTVTQSILAGSLSVDGTVPEGCRIEIEDMTDATVRLGSGSPSSSSFAGKLVLVNGIPDSESSVQVIAGFVGEIDLTSDSVAGTLAIQHGTGTISNGGVVSGTVYLGQGGCCTFGGTARFERISSTGSVETLVGGDFDGQLYIGGATGGAPFGDMDGAINLVDDFGSNGQTAGRIEISGVVRGDITVSGEVMQGADISIDGKMEGSTLTVEGNVDSSSSTITIADMVTAGFAGHSLADFQQDFAGTLNLDSGIKANQEVRIGGELTSNDSIDLNSQAVAGTLKISGGGSGTISDGGAVSGTVILADGSANTYSGTATFASVERSGQIKTLNGAHISGQLNITADCSGDIDITGDLSADIDIGGDLEGDLAVDGDMTSTGSTTVDGTLGGSGRILVSGQIAGPIKVGEKTGSLTLIQLAGGLATGGRIEINTSQGVFDAEGDIHIGPSANPVPLPFEGCIRIYESRLGGGGNLRNDLQVVGCHDEAGEELMICIDGNDGGNVTLVQTGCPGVPATWGCPSPGCP